MIDQTNAAELSAAKALASKINEAALKFGGTVSGEHGVGTGKMKYMEAEHGAAYHLMGTLKQSIDPDNIMNPGKMVALN